MADDPKKLIGPSPAIMALEKKLTDPMQKAALATFKDVEPYFIAGMIPYKESMVTLRGKPVKVNTMEIVASRVMIMSNYLEGYLGSKEYKEKYDPKGPGLSEEDVQRRNPFRNIFMGL